MAQAKPADINKVWAESGDTTKPADAKIDIGWEAEIPTRQNMNWLQNLFGAAVAHFNQFGIAEWDAVTDYPVKGWARGSDGLVYESLVTPNIGNDPVSSPTQWLLLELGGGGLVWNFPTTDFAAEEGNGYMFSGTAVTTVTLPASPVEGDEIGFYDLDESWATNPVTVNGNGTNIEGGATLGLNLAGSNVQIVYNGATSQWEVANIGGGAQGPYQIVADKFGAGIGPFTLSSAAASEESILVTADGVLQPSDAYTVAGDQLTLTSAAASYVHVRNIGVPLNIGTLGDGTVTEVKLANGVIPLGVLQTWQDLTASRAFNVTYTNTTGRPIQVAVTAVSGAINSSSDISILIDGVLTKRSKVGSISSTFSYASVSVVIPDGSTYLLTPAAGSTVYTWNELR